MEFIVTENEHDLTNPGTSNLHQELDRVEGVFRNGEIRLHRSISFLHEGCLRACLFVCNLNP